MKIFISHISEHAQLAQTLKEVIQASLPADCTVFVSSDTRDIPPGCDWRDRIDEALEGAGALIVLCSSASVHRPWIPFETACGWIKRVPVIPVCFGGMTRGTLPLPISRFQALDLKAGFAKALLAALADHLDVRLPRLDLKGIERDLLDALDEIGAEEESTSEVDEDEDDEDGVGILDEPGEEILRILAEHDAQPPRSLAEFMGIHPQKAQYWCEKLEGKGLLTFYRSMVGEPSAYGISAAGRAYVVENDLLE